MKSLRDSVQYVKGVGPRRLEILARLGIQNIRDLLYFIPRDYEDRSRIAKIGSLRAGDKATIKARVIQAEKYRARGGRPMARVLVGDDTGTLTCIWFNARFFRENDFPIDREMLFTGRVDFYDGLQMSTPQYELADEGEALFGARILPVYPLTQDLNQTSIRRLTQHAVEEYAPLAGEIHEDEFLKERELMPLAEALRQVHFPESMQAAAKARRRLAYDELFILEAGMAIRRHAIRVDEPGIQFKITPEMDARIRRRFPFTLTDSQEKVIEEIRQDMQQARPMNRMLQGDVGSGKTAVALYGMLAAVANHCQAALMAPTEILAAQHFANLQKYLEGSRVRMALLTGGLASRERAGILKGISEGQSDIVIGTHALLESAVSFKNLGFVVVDEQHKFGVLQRASLRQKGRQPDVLVMTATPIPRTLALTVFGDLDFSVIDKMPPGRRPPKTIWYPKAKLPEAYEFIRGKVTEGDQVFMVYPLVEESEALDLKAAAQSQAELQRKVFPEFRVGLLHGRMRSDEKDAVMNEFRAGRYHILVSTIVIEVGIDIPNATIMVVEHAERFGLAQLHQLRGRIGRGPKPSFFLLFGEPRNELAEKRLRVICATSDGFKIAEEDLKLRGPGEFFGTRQHGLPELHIASIIDDYQLLRLARRDAFKIVAEDPGLNQPVNQPIRQRLEETFKDRLELIRIG